MADDIIQGTQYRLRCSQPMPIVSGDFVLHTFRAEKTRTDILLYTQSLPGSDQFRGQGGGYMSATFSRLNDRCGNSFSGRIDYPPEYVEEEELNFNL